ncbi:hypothetical protein [Nostoc sp. CALU 1950]
MHCELVHGGIDLRLFWWCLSAPERSLLISVNIFSRSVKAIATLI